MKLKTRIASGILAFLVGISSFPAYGHEKKKEPSGEETEIIEVGDLMSLQEAADSAEDEKKGKAISGKSFPWQSRRLLVKSDAEFDPVGARSMILGYEDMYILDYASEKEARQAYERLQAVPGIDVEADIPYEGASEGTCAPEAKKEEGEFAALEGEASAGKGRDILVAVIDSGYDIDSYGDARLSEGTDLTGSGGIRDDNGHGTAMANIILEHTPENVKVMPVKVADENGRTSSLKLYMGIRYAIENQADIINISMSAYKAANAEVIHAVIAEAGQAGICVVAAAGNAGKDVADFSPANAKDAIAVSAVDAELSLAEYSNRGEGIDYCSYGSMQALGIHGKTVCQEGTSVAAAIVSAAFAKAKSCRNDCSYQELIRFLDGQARDLGEAGKDGLYGNGFLSLETISSWEPFEKGKLPEILSCDWKNMPLEELNHVIGGADNLERRVFLESLDEEEKESLLSKGTLFSERVIYSENTFDGEGHTEETLRMQGTLYDIVMSDAVSDEYEVQAQKYHIFSYGSKTGTKSCIKLDTEANKNDAVIYCWMKDLTTDDQNNGKYGITFVSGSSAYDFSACTHKIENCDKADSGNPVVWRLKIRGVKAQKPENMAVDYNSDLWKKSDHKITEAGITGHKANYWYVYHYQVKPASDADRERAYGDGRFHGGFWDLDSASGKKCGSTVVTTAVDIGSVDLYTHDKKDGITYRLPLIKHTPKQTSKTIKTEATCAMAGSSHEETTYTCSSCDKTWKSVGASVSIPRLAHAYVGKYGDNNGIANGKYWEECKRNCKCLDVNGENWQRNVKYLQPVSYYEMRADGTFDMSAPTGTERGADYYAQGAVAPAWKRTPSDEFLTGELAAFTVPGYAQRHTVAISRKRYMVQYDGNGATEGETKSQQLYCGQIFDLRDCGFRRTGYEFIGWSKSKDKAAISGKSVKNLSLSHNDTVTLYALWKPVKYKITLDNQNAGLEEGTKTVYEHFATGYYRDEKLTETFADEKIEIPQKERADASLPDGVRKQQFLGYYTKPGGNGHKAVLKNGSLVANLDGKGDYQYFSKDSTVYADWEDMYSVRFDVNLSEEELAILREGESGGAYDEPVICPFTRWKEKGKSISIGFGGAIVKNKEYADLYRLKGWSLTPRIGSDDEIILSKDKAAYTFSKDQDVTLYAQWDSRIVVAYAGNGQTEGDDYFEEIETIAEQYAFSPNAFEKTVQKPVKDVATGKWTDKSGKPCMETVACSFQGWSMAKEKERQKEGGVFVPEDGNYESYKIALEAKEAAKQGMGEGMTFGAPASGYVGYSGNYAEDVPFITMYAVWDEYPQIQASDMYFPLRDAQNGILTEEFLLSLVSAADEELKSPSNESGEMKKGIDPQAGTSFTIQDYQASDFTDTQQEMNITVTYRAQDAVGNVAVKMVRIYLADTSGESYEEGKTRFISVEHADTLAQNSIWRTGEHAKKLASVLNNKKTGEEYSEVTPAQRVLGIRPVVKPGSGKWEHSKETWEFTHAQVLEIQEYAQASGTGGDPSEFLAKFGHCRKR